MNLVDVLAALVVAAGAIGGWRLGFVTRITSWVGLAVGLALGVLLVRWMVDRWGGSGPLIGLAAIVVLLLAALGGQSVGFVAGARLRRPITGRAGTVADHLAGAVTGVVGVVVLLWLLLPVVSGTAGWAGRQARNAWVTEELARRLPVPPDAMGAVRAALGEDRFPVVFEEVQAFGPAPPPPAATGLDEATSARVAASVVRIEGEACNALQDGTGWVVGPELVMTNAHVVAGEADTDVIRDDGRAFSGTVVAFDPGRDLALLRTPGLGRAPLPIAAEARPGQSGGVFGHPGGGPLRIAPFSVVARLPALGRDIYDRPGVRREVLELAATLRPGDSGSPVVTPAGEVVGTAFAIADDRSGIAYALAPSELRETVASASPTAVSTQACAR